MNSPLELSASFGGVYAGKRVLVTGHTGFKGSWLCEWLLALGADVTGLALPPSTEPALFDQLGLAKRLQHRIGDIRDLAVVEQAMAASQPEFVFHLAAQPLVRVSYAQPVETYAINVVGTVHVLEALRQLSVDRSQLSGPSDKQLATNNQQPHHCVAVMITTDKCYENREWVHSYREEDPLGGHDPYSSSKAAAELVISAYRRSFFQPTTNNRQLATSNGLTRVCVASARAGNVIGGGDWAADRIVPDCIRSLQRGEAIAVRNKNATRPWQHVLEPLSGYLWLAARLADASYQFSATGPQLLSTNNQQQATNKPLQAQLASAFNFGPNLTSNRTVAELVQEVLKHWPGSWEDRSDPTAPHEAGKLNLATDKAFHLLGWQPVWTFDDSVRHTVSWYRQVADAAGTAPEITQAQICDYTEAARQLGLPWAQSAV